MISLTLRPTGTCNSLISFRPVGCCDFHIHCFPTTNTSIAPGGALWLRKKILDAHKNKNAQISTGITVHVTSSKSKGTSIQLRVPLTLASIQTLLFRVGGRLFAVPLSAVVEITRIQDQEIHKVDQREVLRLRDQILTLVRLDQLNRIHTVEAPSGAKKKRNFVVVIGLAEKRFGLVVDSMVGEEELVIKALPGEIVSSDLVSGASILGDGTVVLILNVPAILSRLSRSLPLGAIA